MCDQDLIMNCRDKFMFFAFVLLLTGVTVQGECTAMELISFNNCALSEMANFSKAWQKGVCNHTLITPQLCDDFVLFANCFNSADVSASACRPFAVSLLEAQFDVPCKVRDFVVVCDCAPALDEGNGANMALHSEGLIGLSLGHVTVVLIARILN